MHQRYVLGWSHPLRATIVMAGGSLLSRKSETKIEVEGKPINISQGGVCLLLEYDATWEVLSSNKDLEIHLQNGKESRRAQGWVTHFGHDRSLLGIKFHQPLSNLASLINPN